MVDRNMKFIYILLFFPCVVFASELHSSAKSSGAALYKQHCLSCHGEEGKGSIGPPLGVAKIAQLSDSYLLNTMKKGRPGRVMPAITLTNTEYQNIITYLRTGTPAPTYNSSSIIGNAKAGKPLYYTYCSSCHNAPPVGGEGVGKNYSWDKKYKVAPPALANSGFLSAISDHELKHLIKVGIPGSEMLGYNRFLTSGQVNDIIAYIKSYKDYTPHALMQDSALSYVFDSAYDLDTTVTKIQNAIKAANFRVYTPRKLLEDLTTKETIYSKQVVIRFCNFEHMLTFIKIEPRLGIVLPCRITVIENNQAEVKVVIENYKRTVAKFNNMQISLAADELITSLTEIIEEALW